MSSPAAPPSSAVPPPPAEPAEALNLAALPDEALQRVLSADSLTVHDLGRAACVSKRLRAAAGDGALPQWRAVRAVGSVCQWPWLKPDIFEGGDDEDSIAELCVTPPYVLGELSHAKEMFEKERWDAACARQRGLEMARMWGFDNNAVKAVESRIEAEWAGMSAAERRVWEDKAAARKAYATRYEAAQLDPKGAWSPAVLRALLARCPNVHTLRLDFPAHSFDTGYKTRMKLSPDDGLLRAVCDAWGPNLRLLHLAGSRLSVADVHDVLARCPRLRWLGAGYVVLRDPDGSLFRDMARHVSLRAIVLPVAARKHLAAYTARLCERCPALREIDASLVTHEQAHLVASCARRAAAAGVRRFMCASFFEGGGSDGEWGSDGGSVGEYCGDGDVIKYVAPQGAGAAVADDDDEPDF